MKLRVVSDLHLDFHADGGDTLLEEIGHGTYDVMVVAGDISAAPALEGSLRLLMKHTPKKRVLYVPGNHDYYGSTWEDTQGTLRRVERDFEGKLFVMMDDIVSIETKWFIGTTLWFPWKGMAHSDAMLGDFHHIRGFRDWIGRVASGSADFLREKVEPDMVVVTHHMPHEVCVAPRFRGSPLNRYFVHDVGEEVVRKPRMWIHGHTHDSLFATLGSCRIVCNPFGYARVEENKAFRPDLDVVV